MSSCPPSPAVLLAAKALGLNEHALSPLRGAAGQTWSAGEHILRARPVTALAVELAACAAGRRVLPAPEVLDVVHHLELLGLCSLGPPIIQGRHPVGMCPAPGQETGTVL